MYKNKNKKPVYKQKNTNQTEYSKTPEQEYLIIVESPSKCIKIEGFLGIKYKCIATIGHLREIKGLKAINEKQNYKIMFSILESKTKHIESMRKIMNQFQKKNILLATDDDREGEAISWHICDIFDLDVTTTSRIIFHEVTSEALLRAVSSYKTINMSLVQAQWARQVLDILIGFNISPVLWKYMYYDKENSLSAGRCQTPALRLVYDNEQEMIEGGGVEKMYKIRGYFTDKHLEFILSKEFQDKQDVIDFLSNSKDFPHVLSLCSPKENIISPPKPLNTSTLLQTASNILHMSPKDTMKFCQVLYQNGYITYMRTENKKYSSEYLKNVKEYIQGKWNENHVGNISELENVDKSNPHEAIRVTHLNITELSGEEYVGKISKLYQLIWRISVQSCMKEAKYQNIDIHVSCPLTDHKYKHTVEIPIFLGWKNCMDKHKYEENQSAPKYSLEKEQSTNNGLYLYLQSISNKSDIPYKKIETIMTFHNKHSHYTEASLIKKLEDFGIGRPSTFAIFMETILERGYVKKTDIEGEKISCTEYVLEQATKIIECNTKEYIIGNEKSKLVIQPTGKLVIEFLMKYFNSIFDYNYSRDLEEKLDKISLIKNDESVPSWYSICEECDNLLKQLIKPLNKLSKTIYSLDNEHDVIFTKYGATIKKKDESENLDKKSIFMPIKRSIVLDLDRLKRGEYKLEELQDIQSRYLGIWNEEEIYIKNGQYGAYLEWGNNKKSCNNYKKDITEITIEDVKIILNTTETNNMNILRILNKEMSVRRGKFGPYIYYQTTDMKKPRFLNIKGFKEGFVTCDVELLIEWIEKKYLNKK
jgi:DNA topoisomerase-1